MSRHDISGSFILAVSEIDELAIGCSISGVNLIVGKEPICRVLQQTRTALQPPDLTPRPGEPGELARRWELGELSRRTHCVRVQCRGGGPWAGGRAAGSVIDNNVTPIHALFSPLYTMHTETKRTRTLLSTFIVLADKRRVFSLVENPYDVHPYLSRNGRGETLSRATQR